MEGNKSLLNQLSNWFNKFKRYTVSYRNGAFHLYNLFNSPETMIESFDNMAFCTHDRSKKMQLSDNIFLKSIMYYTHLEEGLWVITSNLYFKKNVLMENLYDKNYPIDYHFINIHVKTHTVANKSLVNGLILKDKSWSMFKAGHAITEYHFKKSNEKNITIFFTSKWLEKQKAINPIFSKSKLVDFFESSNTYLILHEESSMYEGIYEELMHLCGENENNLHDEKVKSLTFEVLLSFIDKLKMELVSENHFELNDKDRKRIQRVEQYLYEHLFKGFPGIEKTASKVGVSATKLKNDFKMVHHTSLYKYFSDQQMQAAHQLLSENNYSVKEVATLLGYENASKFTAVFKKKFDITPSMVNE